MAVKNILTLKKKATKLTYFTQVAFSNGDMGLTRYSKLVMPVAGEPKRVLTAAGWVAEVVCVCRLAWRPQPSKKQS